MCTCVQQQPSIIFAWHLASIAICLSENQIRFWHISHTYRLSIGLLLARLQQISISPHSSSLSKTSPNPKNPAKTSPAASLTAGIFLHAGRPFAFHKGEQRWACRHQVVILIWIFHHAVSSTSYSYKDIPRSRFHLHYMEKKGYSNFSFPHAPRYISITLKIRPCFQCHRGSLTISMLLLQYSTCYLLQPPNAHSPSILHALPSFLFIGTALDSNTECTTLSYRIYAS